MTIATGKARRGSKVKRLPHPDDDLSLYDFILKYQLYFTKNFGPKYAYGVTGIGGESGDGEEQLHITARVRPAYQSVKGKYCYFNVPIGKYRVWRQNVKLINFVSVK